MVKAIALVEIIDAIRQSTYPDIFNFTVKNPFLTVIMLSSHYFLTVTMLIGKTSGVDRDLLILDLCRDPGSNFA